ncbi:MAG TPA: hypothetical protein DDW53_16855 [Lachnoclostridium sp.]|nr:hypothetical protein [Lachnoclostridium sp.]
MDYEKLLKCSMRNAYKNVPLLCTRENEMSTVFYKKYCIHSFMWFSGSEDSSVNLLSYFNKFFQYSSFIAA